MLMPLTGAWPLWSGFGSRVDTLSPSVMVPRRRLRCLDAAHGRIDHDGAWAVIAHRSILESNGDPRNRHAGLTHSWKASCARLTTRPPALLASSITASTFGLRRDLVPDGQLGRAGVASTSGRGIRRRRFIFPAFSQFFKKPQQHPPFLC